MEARIASGDYYDALQLCKSQVSRRVLKNDIKSAAELIVSTFDKFIAHNQPACAVELALILVNTYKDHTVEPDEEKIGCILRMAKALPSSDSQVSFLKAAIKWSAGKDKSTGNASLHQLAAESLWEQHQKPAALFHFVRGNDPAKFASLLIAWAGEGLEEEGDLFLTRAILQCLCAKRVDIALVVFSQFTAHFFPSAAASEKKFFPQPLVNFCHFLIAVCQKDESARPLFQMLRENYSPSIQRDPVFSQYLDIIGSSYFKIELKGGMLDELMKSLFSSGEESN